MSRLGVSVLVSTWRPLGYIRCGERKRQRQIRASTTCKRHRQKLGLLELDRAYRPRSSPVLKIEHGADDRYAGLYWECEWPTSAQVRGGHSCVAVNSVFPGSHSTKTCVSTVSLGQPLMAYQQRIHASLPSRNWLTLSPT